MQPTRRDVVQWIALSSVLAGCAADSRARMGAAKLKPRSVLILGGTKFVGPALVDRARERGHTVTLFNRGKTNPELFPDVEKLRGDRDGDLKALEGRSFDAVIDTSGHLPRIVKASAELLAPRTGQYVFVSSLNAIADLSKPNIDESAPESQLEDPTTEVNNFDTYGGLKVLCEKTAEAAFPGRSTSVRPGLIVGPRDGSDRFTYWPVRVARGGEVLAPGRPDDSVQIIDVRDLAAFLVRVVEERTMGLFNAVGPARKLGIGEMLETCRAVVEANPTLRRFAPDASPAHFTWIDAAFLLKNEVAPWKDMPAWIPNLEEGEAFGTVNCAKAIRAGLEFRPLSETVFDTLAWWNTLPPDRRTTLRTGISPERERAVLDAWRAHS